MERQSASSVAFALNEVTTPKDRQQQHDQSNPLMMTATIQQEQADEETAFNMISPERVLLGQLIGSGNFGQVFRGYLFDADDRETAAADEGKLVAIKTFKHKSTSEMTNLRSDQPIINTAAVEEEEVRHEARIMTILKDHPNILHLYGVVNFNDGGISIPNSYFKLNCLINQ